MQPYNWGDWKSIAYDPKILERSKVLYEKYNAGLKSSDYLDCSGDYPFIILFLIYKSL